MATGGPIPLRGIYPSIKTLTSAGVVDVPEEEVARAFEAIVGTTSEATRPHPSQARSGEQPAGEGKP